jgi:hypothetical protein
VLRFFSGSSVEIGAVVGAFDPVVVMHGLPSFDGGSTTLLSLSLICRMGIAMGNQ